MAIITVSREMGTGAYRISREVAKKLKYTLVDGAKIAELAPSYGLSLQTLERVDEKPPAYHTAEDRLHAAHLKTVELILLDCARQGNVIIYGRGGQDLLSSLPNLVRIRFIAPFEERIENFAEREWLDPELARDLTRKNDHQRGGFIHFYFDRNWQDPLGYDLVFNTSRLSHGAIVDSIIAAAKDPKLKAAENEVGPLLEDIILRTRIEAALLKSSRMENLHLKVLVRNGETYLTGHVHSDEERERTGRIVRRVDGAGTIHDDLQVVSYRRFKE